MTKEELAARLNGREYGNEVTPEDAKAAKAAGLVIAYGASDDLLEFEGAVRDEVDAWEGGTAVFSPLGLVKALEDFDHTEEKVLAWARQMLGPKAPVTATWKNELPPWTISADIPHAKFRIVDAETNGKPFCDGIVFALADIAQEAEA